MSNKKAVVVNYSAPMIAAISADYAAGVELAAIAEKTGKTVASIRAKLSSLGLYKAKSVAIVGKKGGVTKASLVSDISAIVSGDKNGLESLRSATIADLKTILSFLVAEMREDACLDDLLSETEKDLIPVLSE